jgi:hypothetical protein
VPSASSTGGIAETGDEPFPWDALVSRVLHPVQVQIIEAMRWIGRPLASSELCKVFDDAYTVSHLGYHVSALADLSVLREVGKEQVRGATKHYYVLVGWCRS